MKIILASNNNHKYSEFSELVKGLGIELVMQRDAGCDFEVDETGQTFEENAFLKAKAATDATGFPAISDDSGLEVEALGGAPGIYSARYGPGGHSSSDSDKNRFLLSQLEGVENRKAKFVCCICCTFPNGYIIRSRGELNGKIIEEPRGNGGFGYDPIFVSDGHSRTNAELTCAEKNSISHRGKALRSFIPKLEDFIKNGTYK